MAIGLKPLFAPRGEHDFLGLDFGEELLKIVHVRISGAERRVQALSSHDVRGLSDDDVAGLIQKAAAGFGPRKPDVCLALPLQTVITRSIEIPSRDPDEIREIVNLQASRHTPYARSEIVIDYLTLGTVRENYSKVLLVIAPREVVVKQSALVEKAGLRVARVLFPPEGIALACSKILDKRSHDTPVAVVHMDAAFTSYIVVQAGTVLFVRGIVVGARQLTEEGEAYRDRFVEELQKSTESYMTDEAGPAPTLLVLTGVAAGARELEPLFAETLGVPIQHLDYFKHFSISKEARQAAEGSKYVSFFNVIAPLFAHDRMKLDLVTEELKLRVQMERRFRDTVNTGIFTMVILVMLFVSFASKVYFKKAYLDRLTDHYSPVIEEASRLQDLFSQTQAVRQYLASRGTSIESLAELYAALPKEVRLAEVRYEGGTKFSVKGVSRTMASVFAFVTNLEKSELFTNVKTKYVTSRNEDGIDTAEFEITSLIGGEEAS
jgi:Tfp pilus assembly PilM family ATPase